MSCSFSIFTFFVLQIAIFSGQSFSHGAVDFRWEAKLDPKSGLANSFESSQSSLDKKVSGKILSEKVNDIFASYPDWLCGFGVTFGLLKAMKRPVELFGSKKKRNYNEAITIYSSIFNLELLTFGVERGRTRRRNGNAIPSYEYHVIGGLLAYSNDCRGSITFDVFSDNDKIKFESRVNEYIPAISGGAPVNFLREKMYTGSQRLVHAYVMWRYHHFLRQSLKTLT